MNKRNFVTIAALVVLLLAQMVSVSEAGPAAQGKPGARASWTFMVYIVGDNNLDPYVRPDIETELAPAGSNADVSVVALADRAATAEWSQTLLFYVTQGMLATPENAVEDWDEANMGDPQTLIQFHPVGQGPLSSRSLCLVLWNHGWSWRPYQSMVDDTDDDTMDQHELQAVLESVGPIDVLMYDACQMASIENEATVRGYSQAIVHSQDLWAGTGSNTNWSSPPYRQTPA